MDRIDVSAVQECVERSVQLLHRTFRSSPTGGGGWYHNLEVGPPGPSATSVGLACMALIARTDNHVAEALEFLKLRQIASTDPLLDGGWAVNTSGGVPVTECTALVGWMLGGARSFLAAGGPDLGRALAWLVGNQNPDDGWGSMRGQPSRTWLTAFAVRAIAQLSPRHEALQRGVEWLTGPAVTSEGAWGEKPGSPPTLTHTAFVLATLVEAGVSLDDPVIVKGYRWLEGKVQPRQLHDPDARMESYNVEACGPDGSTRTWVSVVWHPGLPFAVSALVRGPVGLASTAVFTAVRTIVAAQAQDGRWPGTDGAAQTSIWDVWPYLHALFDVLTQAQARAGDVLTLLTPGVVITQRAGQPDPVRALTVARRRRRVAVLKRHWAATLLGATVVALVTLAAFGLLGWTEVMWGIGIPLLLSIIQEGWHRRPRTA